MEIWHDLPIKRMDLTADVSIFCRFSDLMASGAPVAVVPMALMWWLGEAPISWLIGYCREYCTSRLLPTRLIWLSPSGNSSEPGQAVYWTEGFEHGFVTRRHGNKQTVETNKWMKCINIFLTLTLWMSCLSARLWGSNTKPGVPFFSFFFGGGVGVGWTCFINSTGHGLDPQSCNSGKCSNL